MANLTVEPITFEAFNLITEDSSEPFFREMKRGLIDDKCTELIKCAFYGEVPLGFIATKHYPKYSNLKWVATLPEARGKGAFRTMCEEAVFQCWKGSDHNSLFPTGNYFRVSINGNAIEAYQKVGFKIHGKQRSNCYLSMGKTTGPRVEDIDWERDSFIWKAINQQPRGGCIEVYEQPK